MHRLGFLPASLMASQPDKDLVMAKKIKVKGCKKCGMRNCNCKGGC